MKKKYFFLAFLFIGCIQKNENATATQIEQVKAEVAKAEADKAKAEADKAKAEAEVAKAEVEIAKAQAGQTVVNANAAVQVVQTVTRSAVINDRDGWTNVRVGPSDKTAIVKKMWDGDIIYVDYTPGKRWVPVRETEHGSRIGYIYAKLIRLL